MVVFDRPIGAGPDTKEIEYTSAIHQTGAHIRPNGSIKDEDIQLYLKSRFGIVVTLEQVRSTIMHGFAGGDEGTLDATEVIDMMELTAIILIPLLLKTSIVEGEGKTLPKGVLPPPGNLLKDVIDMIVHDSGAYAFHTNKDGVTHVTADLIKNILLIYGEVDMANDDDLIREMVDACKNEPDEEGLSAFTPKSFGLALTRDVTLFDLTNETRASTIIEDVFGRTRKGKPSIPFDNHDAQPGAVVEAASKGHGINDLKRVYTAPAIDIQAGTYRSKVLIVALWGSVMFQLIRLALENSQSTERCDELYVSEGNIAENLNGIACETNSSVINWLVRFAIFCGFGLVTIGMGGLGNYVGNTRWYLSLIGMTSAFIVAWNDWLFWDLPDKDDAYYFLHTYINVMTGVLGTLAMYCHFTQLIMIIFNNYDFTKNKLWSLIGFSSLKQELHIKKSAAFKLNQLAANALTIHYQESSASVFKTYFGHALSSYTLHGTEYVPAGGLLWFWGKALDGTILEEEGLWYSSRLVAANMIQFFTPILILLLGINVMNQVLANYDPDNSKEQLGLLVNGTISSAMTNIGDSEIFQESVAVVSSVIGRVNNMTGGLICEDQNPNIIDSKCMLDQSTEVFICYDLSSYEAMCALVADPNLNLINVKLWQTLVETAGTVLEPVFEKIKAQGVEYLDSATWSLYPAEKYMLTVPLGMAIAAAVLHSIQLGLMYLPSVTTTLIQLRTGFIPSLDDRNFQKYRIVPDSVTYLTGMMFWGCLVSSTLVGVGTAFVTFILLWQRTRLLVQRLIVLFIGVIVITLIKMLFTTTCTYCFFKGLYRTRPAGANISMLALEWANYVLSVAFILIRMCKLIFVATTSIGKIDRPFLAHGVGQIGSFEFDSYPTIHTRDLVAHEAHRHPYIEILGHMYLLKLRYADRFGNRAGSAWRLIFVYALMPWFHKYRIRDGEYGKNRIEDGDESDIEESGRELLTKKPTSSLVSLSTGRRSPDLKHVGVESSEAPYDSGCKNGGQAMREMEAENIRLMLQVECLNHQLMKNLEKSDF